MKPVGKCSKINVLIFKIEKQKQKNTSVNTQIGFAGNIAGFVFFSGDGDSMAEFCCFPTLLLLGK